MTAGGPFRRGEVVWGLDPFKELEEDDPDPERSFLVLSNERVLPVAIVRI